MLNENWKNWMRIGLTALALATPLAAQAGDPDPEGTWLRANGTVRMEISQCGSNFCAVNTWVKNPNGKEKVGDRLILTVRQISAIEYQGKAYDLRRRMTYRITLTFQGNHMKTSGCVLLGIICRSTSWTRTN